ncbi:LysR family transcriptional regulator [Paraburkholderia sp.]|uniref:LysR family transcriptional regulator n=1 Tax=Paraburkholderia sp. TaxID=1926495 RepID=UPI002389715F|nr:LysR family transcriptional regulator [Paraburkholderia sp.]MDE1179373.1 LysR family transcriptional regulator [Paraburkholderia sp.]
MRKNLDYGLLHAMTAFVRVVDAGTFTLAAEQMELTTAQISRLVSGLEARLHTKLLQRTTRRIALTGTGETYVAQCRDILERVDVAEAFASGSTIEPAGRLRVQCMGNFGNRYVVPLIAGFCAQFPKVSIEYATSQYAPALLAEGIDVGIYISRQLSDSGLVALPLGTVFSVLCASPDYIAAHGSPKHPRDLADHACVRLVNFSAPSEWELMSGKRSFRLQPGGSIIADNPDVLLSVAEQGSGISLLPFFTVRESIRHGRLVRVLPTWRTPELGVYALYPSRHFLDAKTKAWLDLLKTRIAPALVADASMFR